MSARENTDVEKYQYCLLLKEDYKECLHHRKAKQHGLAIKKRYLQLKRNGEIGDIPKDVIPDYKWVKDD